MEQLGAAVIGMGMMGERHARVWDELPYTRLISVYDTRPERTDEYAQRFGCLGADSLEAALAAPGVDLVSICTDDQTHLEPCLAAAATGKHILLEKPLATTPQEARQIVAAAAEAPVKLMVGHVVRFGPRYQAARQAIEAGEVGDVVYAYARRFNVAASGWRIGPRASVTFFLGIHDIDILQWLTGSRIVRVHAEGCSKVLRDIGVDDTIVSVLKFDNGAAGVLETLWVAPAGAANTLDARLDIVGTQGRVQVRVGGEEMSLDTHQRSNRADVTYGITINDQMCNALRTQLEHFAQCVLNDTKPLVSNEDAIAAVDVAWAIDESLRRGETVEVL